MRIHRLREKHQFAAAARKTAFSASRCWHSAGRAGKALHALTFKPDNQYAVDHLAANNLGQNFQKRASNRSPANVAGSIDIYGCPLKSAEGTFQTVQIKMKSGRESQAYLGIDTIGKGRDAQQLAALMLGLQHSHAKE